METVWPVRIAGYCTLRGILRRLINRIGTFDNQIGKDKLQRAENNIFFNRRLSKKHKGILYIPNILLWSVSSQIAQTQDCIWPTLTFRGFMYSCDRSKTINMM